MDTSADAERHRAPRTLGRIESLDLLRGLCALGVAGYHVLGWLGIGRLHNLGLYGVYEFFLLSGASMAVAYAARLRRGYPITSYLALRYIRLAPLYALVATYAALVNARPLYGTAQLVGRWLLNVTFLFGVANPGQTALVTGGWSLGIEFVCYIAFPLLLAVIAARRGAWFVVGLLGVQLVFVNVVLDGVQLDTAWVSYTQFAAFVGYFAFGIWIGLARVAGRFASQRSARWGWPCWIVLVAVIATQSDSTAEGSLTGVRGIALTFACCALLALTIHLDVPRSLRRLATWLGDASYPLYLLHPIAFDILARPSLLGAQRDHHAVRFAVVVLVTSFAAALAVYRWVETPILRWGKRRVAASSGAHAGA